MHRKGQGALEYLLLIGGAILVAIVVITVLTGFTGPATQTQANENTARALCQSKPASACAGIDANVGIAPNNVVCDCQIGTSGACESEATCLIGG